jgi:hypothetical protein
LRVIERARRRLVADRRPHRLGTDHALEAKPRHQPLDGAAGNRKAFSPESVDVDQSVLGRIFDFGTVLIRGTGATLSMFISIERRRRMPAFV